jgi:hypothetical protein
MQSLRNLNPLYCCRIISRSANILLPNDGSKEFNLGDSGSTGGSSSGLSYNQRSSVKRDPSPAQHEARENGVDAREPDAS